MAITFLSSFHVPVGVYIYRETLRTVSPPPFEADLTATSKHSVIWNRDLSSFLILFPKTHVPSIPPLNRAVLKEAFSRTVRSKGCDKAGEKGETC
ncbi:MAG: hypothetical protein ACE5OR_17030, partial [bacterium]